MKRVFKCLQRLSLVGFVVAAVLLVVGASWHWSETRKTEQQYPIPGKMVDLGTHRLHYVVQGAGTPVVVMDNGLLGGAWGFEAIQEDVATCATTCTFDRAGHCWSESGPKPRDPRRIVEELRAMLKRLELHPPYVLVGFSLGGLHMRYYASTYPDEVAGLVLVEALNTDLLPSDLEHPFGGRPSVAKLLYATVRFGSARLIYPRFFSNLDIAKNEELFQKWLAFNCRTKDVLAVRDEYDAMCEWREVRDQMKYLGDMPVAVISGNEGYPPHDWWVDSQKALGAIADEVEVIEANCGHGVVFERPEVVVRAVQDMVERVRASGGR